VKCATCEDDRCFRGDDCFGVADEVRPAYDDRVDRSLMRAAAEVEAEGYGKLTRIEELFAFCKKLPAKRVGIAFCVGLSREAGMVQEALEQHGLEVHSACCKVCGLSKEDLCLPRLRDSGFETACNPIGQAFLLNRESTDLNLIVGLCLGHDMLFAKHSAAPVSTLIVKDRVLGHNPAATLYSSYHSKRLIPAAAELSEGPGKAAEEVGGETARSGA
jgi:uncharacterized metal-binding protein